MEFYREFRARTGGAFPKPEAGGPRALPSHCAAVVCPVMPVATLLFALVTTATISSCSIIAIQRPPGAEAKPSQEAPLSCTGELTYPLIDMAGTVLAGVLTVSLLSSNSEDDLKVASYSSGAIAIGFAASAIYGMLQVNRCREGKRRRGELSPVDSTPNEDREVPGSHGGPCKVGGACDDDLYCDEPMQVCIPLNPRE